MSKKILASYVPEPSSVSITLLFGGLIFISGACLLTTMGNANAAQIAAPGSIFSPTGYVINNGGSGEGSLQDTINGNGLSLQFVSGVTNFDSYLSGNPTHTLFFLDSEWFSNSETTSASVTYDFGTLVDIDRLALWNEETSGIGLLNLYSSQDGVTFSPLAPGLKPIDNPFANYPAQVFSFGRVNAQYVRFDMSECPQPDPAGYPSCAIGEVAFRAALQVPEPSSILGTLVLGSLGAAAILKRKL